MVKYFLKYLIHQKIKDLKPGEWVLGFGWDQNLWKEKEFPDSNLLNSQFKKNPIYLTRIDGHSAWVNDIAILKAGLSFQELNYIKGGKVINNCIMHLHSTQGVV